MKPSGFGNRTLINDKPILVLPELAKKVGLNEAIVLQQLHYWLINAERANRNYKDGKYWIYNTYAEWQEQFPWWSVRTIRRIFTGLEEEELILTANYNKMPIDKTKWYTINYQKIDDIFNTTDKNGRPCGQSGQTDSPKWTDRQSKVDTPITRDYTETTQRLTTDIRHISDPSIRECLKILKGIDNYPFDVKKDLDHVAALAVDFPNADLVNQVKRWRAYKLDKPLLKNSNARLQLRNWLENAEKWRRERVTNGAGRKQCKRNYGKDQKELDELDQIDFSKFDYKG